MTSGRTQRRGLAGFLLLIAAVGVAVSAFQPLVESNVGAAAYEDFLRRVNFHLPVQYWLWPLITVAIQSGALAITGILLLRDRAARLGLGLVLGIAAWLVVPAIEALLRPQGAFEFEPGPGFWMMLAGGSLGILGGILGIASIPMEPRTGRGPSADMP